MFAPWSTADSLEGHPKELANYSNDGIAFRENSLSPQPHRPRCPQPHRFEGRWDTCSHSHICRNGQAISEFDSAAETPIPRECDSKKKTNFKETSRETRKNTVRIWLRETKGEAAGHSWKRYPHPAMHATSQTVKTQDSCPQPHHCSAGYGQVAGGMSFTSSAGVLDRELTPCSGLAATGNKSATRAPLSPLGCGGEWKEKGRNRWVKIRAVNRTASKGNRNNNDTEKGNTQNKPAEQSPQNRTALSRTAPPLCPPKLRVGSRRAAPPHWNPA